jgi:hypothetical protein
MIAPARPMSARCAKSRNINLKVMIRKLDRDRVC